MAKPGQYLLPPAADLALLSEQASASVIQAVNEENRRAHTYAMLGMICGTVSFLACIASFSYLVINGHPQAAGVILGTGVLAIIGRMIAARL
jgi:hypothetical protein